ncbi:MAG: GcrA family cell cycle regulator [Rhodospirillales bacterium]
MEWTPIRISALIALWDEGISTSEIGRRLGVTKNAVVGKVHRLGLTKRRPTAQPAKAEEAEVINLEQLGAGMCSWPDGDPKEEDLSFCGQQTVPGKPYCAEHCAKAYVKSTRKGKGVKVTAAA